VIPDCQPPAPRPVVVDSKQCRQNSISCLETPNISNSVM
jgi:hypothetical protein